ncbi:MAG: hypothetical protein HZC40_12350 [Chloroflexi bacterium]|nr:hypothetical protein [Chloroflexota bacterium]
MPKSHKKIKHLEIEHTQPHEPARPRFPKEDFVGRFLASVAIAFVTGLISQAISNQVNWWIVALAFSVSLGALIAYQKFG